MYSHFASWSAVAKTHAGLMEAAGRYFPFLWSGGTSWLAIDLQEQSHARVALIEFESDTPIREAYGSFTECIVDLVRANREGDVLSMR